MTIIKQFKNLKKSVHNPSDTSEILDIIRVMTTVLDDNPSHYYITSNMIGYDNHRIVLIKIDKPIVLVNPIITHYGEFTTTNFPDTSLMYPNQLIKTTRHTRIIVTSDNVETPVIFGVDNAKTDLEINKMLEAGYIQHAIDVLDGKTMFHSQTDILNKNIKPNSFIRITKDGKEKQIKGKFLFRELSLGFKLI